MTDKEAEEKLDQVKPDDPNIVIFSPQPDPDTKEKLTYTIEPDNSLIAIPSGFRLGGIAFNRKAKEVMLYGDDYNIKIRMRF